MNMLARHALPCCFHAGVGGSVFKVLIGRKPLPASLLLKQVLGSDSKCFAGIFLLWMEKVSGKNQVYLLLIHDFAYVMLCT